MFWDKAAKLYHLFEYFYNRKVNLKYTKKGIALINLR